MDVWDYFIMYCDISTCLCYQSHLNQVHDEVEHQILAALCSYLIRNYDVVLNWQFWHFLRSAFSRVVESHRKHAKYCWAWTFQLLGMCPEIESLQMCFNYKKWFQSVTASLWVSIRENEYCTWVQEFIRLWKERIMCKWSIWSSYRVTKCFLQHCFLCTVEGWLV